MNAHTDIRVQEPGDAELRTLIDQAPDAIFIADADGRLGFVNDAAGRLLGYPRAELLGKPIADLLPSDGMGFRWMSGERPPEGGTQTTECRMRRKDATWVKVEVSARFLADGRWQGFVRDVSERKAPQAERQSLIAAIESERPWLHTVLDPLPVGVLLFEPDGRLSFNRRAEQLFGMSLSPTRGSAQYAGLIHFPDGSPVGYDALPSTRALRGETVHATEQRVHRADGSTIPILASSAPIRDAGDNVAGCLVVFQDVTERVRMEQEIIANEHLLKGIFDILPVGVWVADRNGRIVSNNPAAERIWKGARYVSVPQFGEYKGWWIDSGKPIAAEEWALARALTRGETSTGEFVRIQCFDGSFKTIINSAAPLLDAKGQIAGAIVVNEDISALQHTQEQLRAAVRDREQILAIVTHDLRSPLHGIAMGATAVEVLASEFPNGQLIREQAAAVVEISRQMSGMVEDLLSVATTTIEGRPMLRLSLVDASSLVNKATDAVRPLFAKKGIEFECRTLDHLPTINVDSDRVLRVFANLLDNALKFTSPPGRITLTAESTTGGVQFSVANTGAPIPSDQLEAMFLPFWQAQRDRRGAGLGLSICRSIVEAHGGSIWGESSEGMQVRVCFVLPSGVSD